MRRYNVPKESIPQYNAYIKILLLQVVQRLYRDTPGAANSIIEQMNSEILSYMSLEKYCSIGFSLYYNDFTDTITEQKPRTEKEIEKEEYGFDIGEPAFEDEVFDEDDSNLPQD